VIHQVTGDADGRIYACSNRGIDRLEPETGRVKHFSEASGLTGGEFQAAFRDRNGVLWFGTSRGLIRLIPEDDREFPPSPVYISGIRISGLVYPISELGERDVSALEIPAGQNNVEIDYFALSFVIADAFSNQSMLA